MVGQIEQEIFEEKGMIGTLSQMENGLDFSFPNRKLRHPMDSKGNKCAPFVKYDNQGNYDVMHKVLIASQAPLNW
jgi:hypothetical protein